MNFSAFVKEYKADIITYFAKLFGLIKKLLTGGEEAAQ